MRASVTSTNFSALFLSEVEEVARKLDASAIEEIAARLRSVRENAGRLFILGVGGSAANASHAVNDFRKIVGFESMMRAGQRYLRRGCESADCNRAMPF